MVMEAALCTIPLFGLGILIGAMVPYSTIETGGLALAFSAGLYEELVFRLLLIEAGRSCEHHFSGDVSNQGDALSHRAFWCSVCVLPRPAA